MSTNINIAAMIDDLGALQDCAQTMTHEEHNQGHEQANADGDCCCDVSCDGCCATGFSAVSAVITDNQHVGYLFSQNSYSDLSHSVEGVAPKADFRPPISRS